MRPSIWACTPWPARLANAVAAGICNPSSRAAAELEEQGRTAVFVGRRRKVLRQQQLVVVDKCATSD
ncbi:hypothetical protein MAHJHV35_47740 [Mycobacterium avium subsp. hominissuis]